MLVRWYASYPPFIAQRCMLSHGYELPSCHWPWTLCAASQERPIDLYRYVGARRTHCSTSGEKRHGRGGNVSIGYGANMHGHFVMQLYYMRNHHAVVDIRRRCT